MLCYEAMVSWWHAVLLGLLQGLTEFLPVSSSGHLALAQMAVPGFEQPGVVFDAVLHVGTALAVVAFEAANLRRWLMSKDGLRLAVLLVVGTAATAVVAFPLRSLATGAFESLVMVGVALLVTGCVVASSRLVTGGGDDESTTSWWQAVVIGLAQGAAVFPGLSRSGLTIVAGLGAGLRRPWAARLSFLMGVPAIVAATAVELTGHRAALVAAGGGFWLMASVGAVAAGASGYVALKVVLATVSSRVFHRFAWYCLPLGAIVLALAAGRAG